MRLIVFLVTLMIANPVWAQSGEVDAPLAYTQLSDPAKEAIASELMKSLRCIQCQGQSIADSDAPIAGAMRSEVRQRIKAGESPDQIRKWLIERYGEYVSYQPPASGIGLLLWFAPAFFLGLGLWMARGLFRKEKS